MLINFFDCKYHDIEEFDDGDGGGWSYYCNNIKNETGYCELDNKYNKKKDNCVLLDVENGE